MRRRARGHEALERETGHKDARRDDFSLTGGFGAEILIGVILLLVGVKLVPTIELTEEVWKEIARRGQFGETEDVVLRRLFGLEQIRHPNPAAPANRSSQGTPRRRFATDRQSVYSRGDRLIVSYESGARQQWSLPAQDDKLSIRRLIDEVTVFGHANGATHGQVLALRKWLTERGWHLTK